MRKSVSGLGVVLVWLSTAVLAAAPLQVQDAWLPEAPPVARVMAGYMTIHNPGKQDVTITGARTESFAAVEMHQTRVQDGMARMIKQDTLVIPAGQTIRFERGGLHLMLMQPKQALKAGDQIALTLDTNAGQIKLTATVRPATLDDGQHDHHHHHH